MDVPRASVRRPRDGAEQGRGRTGSRSCDQVRGGSPFVFGVCLVIRTMRVACFCLKTRAALRLCCVLGLHGQTSEGDPFPTVTDGATAREKSCLERASGYSFGLGVTSRLPMVCIA